METKIWNVSFRSIQYKKVCKKISWYMTKDELDFKYLIFWQVMNLRIGRGGGSKYSGEWVFSQMVALFENLKKNNFDG